MIKTIVSLFALYQSASSNRLILQATPGAPAAPQQPAAPQPYPWEIPATPPAPPQIQPQPPIIPPGPPQQPVIPPPMPPVVPPGPPAVIPPPTGVVPPPGPPAPPTGGIPPTGGVPPAAPGFPPFRPPAAPAMPAQKLDCKITPPALGNCANSIRTILNPAENFEVVASVQGALFGSTVNIDFTPMGFPTERISLLSFVGNYAAMNANINVNNNNGRHTVQIEQIKCDKPMACQNTRFVFGPDVEFNQGDFYCTPGACDGCTINGEPCTFWMEPI